VGLIINNQSSIIKPPSTMPVKTPVFKNTYFHTQTTLYNQPTLQQDLSSSSPPTGAFAVGADAEKPNE
jgi:hypothetical protein